MLLNFALQTVINAVALWVAAWAIPGITFGEGRTGNVFWTVVLVALIFGIVNAFIKPVAKLLSMPFIILTLGLFVFIVNALMLELTSWLADKLGLAFHVGHFFWDAVLGALVVTFVSMILSFIRTD
ncbi:phage holin family protein [Terrabacter sp. MAHUQ-38]|jgi:putative membrane protein|uniref:phage holin family protein n=1 Tax=unclassified Terrabacter TaxID=2630222 RepID=UPI00165E8EEF|nr:phage holin family protein [Terrabacter sp. MAHUQ-38]MBC9819812.1 phage holin family protein [Terrabacter sp. MAHUQ-38]